MANKQLRHPGVPIPSWANDDNMVDPARPWDATPTKVEPGAGKRDDGYLPEENPTAQHLNHKFNEIGKWIQYLSSIQVMNWWITEPRDIGAAQINSTECVTYDEGLLTWIVGGRADEVSNSRALGAGHSQVGGGGTAWQETGPTGDAKTWTWAVSKRPDQAPAHVGLFTVLSHSAATNPCNIAELTTGGGWLIYLVPGVGTSSIRQHTYDETHQRWIYVGGTNMAVTPQPAIYTQAVSAALVSRAATPLNSAIAEIVAVSSAGLIVVVGDGLAPTLDVWTSSDGFTFTRATPVGLVVGESARAIIWDDARSVFVLTSSKSCYTSTDGVNYTLLVTYAVGNFAPRCVATDGGGLYVACNSFSDPRAIRYSVDGGVNWRIKAIPCTDGPGTNAPRQIYYSRNEGQFAIANEDNPNQGCLTFSFAIGESLFDADGTLLIPTVT